MRCLPARCLRLSLLLLALCLLSAPSAAVAGPPPGQGDAPSRVAVVVVGVAGLRWDDVTAAGTPALAGLAARGAVGALSVKALPELTCPADGWLTLGAGTRAEAFGRRAAHCGQDLPADLDEQRRRNAGSRDGAVLQALGPARTRGPGAALAGRATPDVSPLLLVDAGMVAEGPERPAQLRRADDLVAEAVADIQGADVLVVGLSEGPAQDTAHLHVVIAAGPSFPRGALRSASTRRAPYVQLIDIAPTVLTLLGRPVPLSMDGQSIVVVGEPPSTAALIDLDAAATAQKQVTVPFFVALIGAELGLLIALRRRPRAARLVSLGGVAAVGASYLAGLVPWWRAGQPLAALLAVVAGLSTLVVLVVARRRHAVGLVCGGTALVLAADLVSGAHLQITGVAGYSPLVAGRFAGLGNVAFGVYGATCLLASAGLAAGRSRGTVGLLVVGTGLLAVAVDGAPPWGSDVGGVLALLPAYAVLWLLLTGTRVSGLRLVLAGLAGVAVVAAFALVDHARPAADRTHLGRFVDQVRDGSAGEVLGRKAQAVFGLLFHSPVTAGLPLVVVAAVALVLRPPPALGRALAADPAHRHGLTAVAVLAGIGFAVNDSGAAVVALALLVSVPATVATVCGADAQPRAAAGSGPASAAAPPGSGVAADRHPGAG